MPILLLYFICQKIFDTLADKYDMSLAEQKKKQRIVADPQNKKWAEGTLKLPLILAHLICNTS